MSLNKLKGRYVESLFVNDFFSVLLLACGEKVKQERGVLQEQDSGLIEVKQGSVEAKEAMVSVPAIPPPVTSSQELKPLDLSLPSSEKLNTQDWNAQQESRYGVETWFEEGKSEERRLKLKTKLRIKEGAEFDKNSNLGSYGDSVDGAEMGFEYKTF